MREGIRQGEAVGFIDVDSIRLGASWPGELLAALAECAVFLPLYSPSYFLSEYCGKEWATFAYRMERHYEHTGVMAEGFVPIVWFQPTRVPGVAQTVHYNTVALGTAYAEWGLRQLIRLRRFEDEYQETVTALAAQIVAIAERSQLLPSLPDLPFDEMESPFQVPTLTRRDEPNRRLPSRGVLPHGSVEGVETTAGPGQTRAIGGSRHVSFVIASTGSDEARTVRSTVECYGPTARHWMPYRPAMTRPLGGFACEIAVRQQFGADLAELDTLDDRIAEANRDNTIVVLLVDPWIARIAGYNARLEAYDRRNEPTVPVLIAMNDQDDETRRCREALDEAVSRAFPNNMLRQDIIFRPAVDSAEQFVEDLQLVLQEAVNRLLRRGTVRRRPPMEAAPARPVLEGPSTS